VSDATDVYQNSAQDKSQRTAIKKPVKPNCQTNLNKHLYRWPN